MGTTIIGKAPPRRFLKAEFLPVDIEYGMNAIRPSVRPVSHYTYTYPPINPDSCCFLLHIRDHTEHPFDLTETQRWDEDHLAGLWSLSHR